MIFGRTKQEAMPQTTERGTTEFDSAAEGAAGSEGLRAGRMGLWALAIGFGGFLLWASIAPLDEGVPATGAVALDTKRKAVQHLSGGIVQEVLVREGEVVEQGQLLVKLDAAVARANYEATRQNYLGLRAMQGRLEAEQAGREKMVFHPDLLKASSDLLIAQQVQNQEQLFQTRRSLLRSDLQSIEESIQGQQALLESYTSMQSSRKEQLRLLEDELGSLRGLVAEGYAPRNRQREVERSIADVRSSLADLQGNQLRARSTILELRQRAISRKQESRKEVESQLSDVRREVNAEQEKLLAVSNDLERMEIRSPSQGQIVDLVVQTVGGIIQPGQKLMDVVPEGEPLMLEVHVPPHMIDRVKSELPVDVRFASFAHTPQLTVQGVVDSVSGDLLKDAQQNVSYFLARVKVTDVGQQELGKHRMQPGMPVEVIFKTGERTLLNYLLHPLTKRIASAMTEE